MLNNTRFKTREGEQAIIVIDDGVLLTGVMKIGKDLQVMMWRKESMNSMIHSMFDLVEQIRPEPYGG